MYVYAVSWTNERIKVRMNIEYLYYEDFLYFYGKMKILQLFWISYSTFHLLFIGKRDCLICSFLFNFYPFGKYIHFHGHFIS